MDTHGHHPLVKSPNPHKFCLVALSHIECKDLKWPLSSNLVNCTDRIPMIRNPDRGSSISTFSQMHLHRLLQSFLLRNSLEE